MYRIPDRWLEYSRCGEVIGETGILASKTPLKKDFNRCKERPEGVPPSEEFTPTQLVEHCKEKGQRVGLVVDLTFSYRYYDPKEFHSLGIQHAKIACPGQEIPDEEIYANFAAVLENYQSSDDPGLIVVHCTHGVNRTGYLVCKFLIDHFKYTADDAIKAFNTARGHLMERENYISDIQDYWQYIQNGDFASTPPMQHSYGKDNWEPQSWDYHHLPYTYAHNSPQWHYDSFHHDFHSQPYHSYGYDQDFYAAPNSFTRPWGSRPHFRRGRFGSGHSGTQPPPKRHSPQRNQPPTKQHQHFSNDQPTPRQQYFSQDQSVPRNQLPATLQKFSNDQTPPEDEPTPRNQHPLCHQQFSRDQPPPKNITFDHHSPKDQPSPTANQTSKDQDSPEDQPSPTVNQTPRDQYSPKRLRPRKNQPPRSACKPSRGNPKRGKRKKQ